MPKGKPRAKAVAKEENISVVNRIKGTISGTFTPTPLTHENYLALSSSTEGWMTEAEAKLLWKTAERVWHKDAQWVEDGSFKGKSTVILGGVLALHQGGWLQAVDPHEGDLSYPSRFENGMMDGESTNVGSTVEAFKSTIKRAYLESYVSLVQHRFLDYEPPAPVDLVFLDGLHDFDNVDADYKHIRPFLAPDATVIFHDVNDWAGPTKVVNYFVECGELQVVEQANSLCVC